MVSKQTIQVLIEAEENVSKAAKKAEEAIKKLGDKGNNAMSKLTTISNKVQGAFSKLSSFVDRAREKFNQFKNSSDKLGMIRSTISNAANSFGQLVRNSDLAAKAMEKLKSVSDGIQAKFTSLQNKVRSFGSSVKSSLTNAFSISNIKSKLTSLGGSIDKLKAKMKSLAAEAKKTGGSGGLGFLKNAASMTVGMLGYDLVNSMMESARASLNARSSMQAFAQRLNMNATEVSAYQKSLDDLQSSFKKIDMDVVGQQATDMAYRLGLPKTSLTELTETTAIFTDAMQRNGRSAEDSMLAMSDAMDGQFVRLKEIGIGQEDLMKNGWSGDLNDKEGLLKAMNKALKEQHYDDLAKSVDTLDDAWQVLSVTMGNLLESILLPLTPVIVGIVTALTGVIDGIMGFVNSLKSAFSGLPEWAQIGIGIAAVAVAVGLAVAAFGGLEAILVSLITSLIPVIIAIESVSLPLIAVVAAIGLVVAAVYELGKAFGWWTDVGSMIDAIGAGIQRLWNHFINHPDVQAAISAISGALQWLAGAVGNAINAVLEFFGVSSGSNWDIVLDIMNAIGFVWDMIAGKIRLIIGVVQWVIGAFGNLASTVSSAGAVLSEIFAPVWTGLAEIFTTVVGTVMNIVTAFQAFQDGQISLSTLLMMIWNAIPTMISTIFSTVQTMVFTFINNLTGGALTAGSNFVNGIITWLSQLPGQAWTWLVQTSTRITTAGRLWVNKARAMASQLVTGVISWLRTLPGRVYSALVTVVGRIASAITLWKNKAQAMVREVIQKLTSPFSGVASSISSDLSGVVSAIKAPFEAAYNAVKPILDKIKAGMDFIGGITGAAGFELGNAAGFENSAGFEVSDESNVSSTTHHEVLDVNYNINIDLTAPSGMSSNDLMSVVNDRDFLVALTGNRDFQELDARVKSRISLKNSRMRGV